MRTIKLSILAIAAAFAMSTFTGCGKGDTGATGPAGAQGNANVSNAVFSITTASSWLYNSNNQYYVDLNVSSLTSTINDGGSVEVSLSIDGGNSWNALPSTYLGVAQNAYWTYGYTVGLVEVYFTWNSLTAAGDPNTEYGTSCYFKVVCVAPSSIYRQPTNNLRISKQLPQISASTLIKPN